MIKQQKRLEYCIAKIEVILRRPGVPNVTQAVAALHEYAATLIPESYTLDQVNLGDIGLSERTLNLLRRHGFQTVREVLNATEASLARIDGFGPKRIAEIKHVLNVIVNAVPDRNVDELEEIRNMKSFARLKNQ